MLFFRYLIHCLGPSWNMEPMRRRTAGLGLVKPQLNGSICYLFFFFFFDPVFVSIQSQIIFHSFYIPSTLSVDSLNLKTIEAESPPFFAQFLYFYFFGGRKGWLLTNSV